MAFGLQRARFRMGVSRWCCICCSAPPEAVKVVLGGFADLTCTECDEELNGDYELDLLAQRAVILRPGVSYDTVECLYQLDTNWTCNEFTAGWTGDPALLLYFDPEAVELHCILAADWQVSADPEADYEYARIYKFILTYTYEAPAGQNNRFWPPPPGCDDWTDQAMSEKPTSEQCSAAAATCLLTML